VLLPLLVAATSDAKTITVAGFDSPAIKTAIGQLQPGDTVQLAVGSYTITEAVRPKSHTKLLGAGQSKTIVRFAGDKPGVMVDLGGCEDVEVANLTLDGDNNPNAHQGLAGGDARRLRVHHVAVRNLVKSKTFGPHGILFSGINPTKEKGVTDSEIADCTFDNIGVGAEYGGGIRLAWGSSRNRVLRNTIRNTGRGGIFGDSGSNDLIIQGNTVTGSGGEGLGIEVWGGCSRAVIEDNRIDHWLSIGGSDCCAVRRNVISDKSGVVKFIGIEGIGRCCVYTDNLVDDGQQIGISVSSTCPKDYAYWAYNTIRNCIQWAAQFQGEQNGVAYHYLYKCRLLGTTTGRGNPSYPGDAGHGFRTNADTKHLVFEECEFSDNGRCGIQLGGANVDFLSFVRCTINNNRGPAVTGPANYTTLAWTDCALADNGNNTLPAARPFPHASPTASFEVAAKARVGVPVNFVSTSKPAVGKIAAVLWDFGDGAPSAATQATHSYSRSGQYRVTLVVWDETGRGARCEKKLRVLAGE
jgi:hypothetical protein